MKMLLAGVLALSLFGSISRAEAGTTLFSTVAADCSVDTGYTSAAVTSSNTGAVSFAAGQTGHILLTCRVTPFSFSGCISSSSIWETVSGDGDGGGFFDSYYVSSWLNSISNGSGSTVSNIAHVESCSGISPCNSGTKQQNSQGSGTFFNSAVNFTSNYIWISVDMYRASTLYNPTFWGVFLSC